MDDPTGTVFAGFQPSAYSPGVGPVGTVDVAALIDALAPVVTTAATTTASAVSQAKQTKRAQEAADKEAAHQRKLAKIQAEAAAKAQVAAASAPSSTPMWIAGGALALGAVALLTVVLRSGPKPPQVPA